MTLSLAHLAWLESERHIDVEVAGRMGVYTGKWFKRGSVWEVRRDTAGDILAFPTVVSGTTVGEHYRKIDPKRFTQRKGSAQVFWNGECLSDPALEEGLEPLVICEGQMDVLAAMTSGIPFAVSMPSGSTDPQGRAPEDLDPLDREADNRPTGRFGSLYAARAQLARVKRFVIATDGNWDQSGIRLAAELVRRLGPGRCSRVEYPPDCKDLNDVLIRHGRAKVFEIVARAKPCPTKGVYRISDFPDAPHPVVWDSGWEEFDSLARLSPGIFIPIAGIPSHGKTRFVLNWLIRVAQRHHLRMALSSFETPIKPQFRNVLRQFACRGATWGNLTAGAQQDLDDWLEETFLVIEHDDRDDTEPMSLDWFLDRTHDALMRYDCVGALIDPWNEIEHQREGNESEAEYQNRALRKIKAFAKRYNLFMVVIAHPTKDIVSGGKVRRPTLYDISGSSAWKNKADLGLGIFRPDVTRNQVDVYTDKVKYEFLGKPGSARFQYNMTLQRFEPLAMI